MNSINLLKGITYRILKGNPDREISELVTDNRKVSEDCAFICIKGARFDTHSCIADVAKKAALIVVSDEYEGVLPDETCIIEVSDTRLAKAFMYANWYNNPADKMTMIGITGSKGKTTITHMLSSILEAAQVRVATIGTNGFILDGRVTELSNTTPDSDEMQMYLAKALEGGCSHVIMECSSQGLMQHRCSGFTFDIGVFTNISEGDHVGPNEHKSFEDYLYCKSLLIRNSRLGIIYGGDEHVDALLSGVDTPVLYYGRENDNSDKELSYIAYNICKTFKDGNPGTAFESRGLLSGEFEVNLPGDFNVTNALAAIAVGHRLGIDREYIKHALNNLCIKGRIDMVYRDENLSICVDFAHNGYSTRNLLTALREYKPKRLVCVFGADGNRAKSRRYEMGEASGSLADYSIITAGHNRYETFDVILEDIMTGMNRTTAVAEGRYIAIPDREEAIRYAITTAKKGDLITIIGLGHESYQEENGIKRPYSDIEYSRLVLKELGKI